ncbi:geminin coiled-coil domain-containing protein 1 [Hyla sarda]|uniref:geminin coiled-coil domain-containing protein 1 n=1 Tax=Hyla sarda TaxID=327740 RepID=UPI0024C24048|nr:geminin coiled-coil domain-containing protein 1 [Hyla sarda]
MALIFSLRHPSQIGLRSVPNARQHSQIFIMEYGTAHSLQTIGIECVPILKTIGRLDVERNRDLDTKRFFKKWHSFIVSHFEKFAEVIHLTAWHQIRTGGFRKSQGRSWSSLRLGLPLSALPHSHLKLSGAFDENVSANSHSSNKMNTILACQDQYFAGGQGYDCPYFSSTSETSVDVTKDTWVSLWASGLLDNRSSNQGPQSHRQSYVGSSLQDDYLWGDQLSGQMFTNKQLQDTLVQREEELARLHEENNKLKQYLNSTFVKCLEEKTKKLLSRSGLGAPLKRKCRVSSLASPETSAKKAKRNLFSNFPACEEQSSPCVDKWVLQTLGLKDVDTIDDSATANYSAISTELLDSLPGTSYGNTQESPSSGYNTILMTPVHSQAGSSGCQDSPCMPDYSPSSTSSSSSLRSSEPESPFGSPIYYTPEVSPNKTDVAFSTSLNPHCNVKTHSFSNGQAFVRRDSEGGWKFTWVPKQSE